MPFILCIFLILIVYHCTPMKSSELKFEVDVDNSFSIRYQRPIFSWNVTGNFCMDLIKFCMTYHLREDPCYKVLNFAKEVQLWSLSGTSEPQNFGTGDLQTRFRDASECVRQFYLNIRGEIFSEINTEQQRLRDHAANRELLPSFSALSSHVSWIAYIICHDAESEKIAKAYSNGHSWAKSVQINSTPFFESIFYQHELLQNNDYLSTFDYVMIAQYRLAGAATLDHPEVARLVAIAHFEDYDVIPIMRCAR